MSMNSTPSSERISIGFFGRRNAGKSSLVNAVTGQDLSVVSPVLGTTTDPVKKAMELLPLGPVVIIDTPGFDDEGELGALRVEKTKRILDQIHLAVLVADAAEKISQAEEQLLALFAEREIPYVIAFNKSDLLKEQTKEAGINDAEVLAAYLADSTLKNVQPSSCISVSALTGENIYELKEKLSSITVKSVERTLIGDLVKPGDICVLVVPIDTAAPKGRLILPQQMTIRDILDHGASALVTKETELAHTLDSLNAAPTMVITDSQAFKEVAKIVPDDVPLTSFSILMARYKGLLSDAVSGAFMLDELQDGDHVLISEGCTHHRQCDDIGTVKMPGWLKKYTGRELELEWTSGGTFPEDLTPYRLIIHCGGCMLNEREMASRLRRAKELHVPMTNYGTAIAHMHGILKRSLEIFSK